MQYFTEPFSPNNESFIVPISSIQIVFSPDLAHFGAVVIHNPISISNSWPLAVRRFCWCFFKQHFLGNCFLHKIQSVNNSFRNQTS